jgi:hypothetical protein
VGTSGGLALHARWRREKHTIRRQTVSGIRLESRKKWRGVQHPSMRASLSRGLGVIDSASKRPAGGKRCSGCGHDSNPEKRNNDSASVNSVQEQSQQHSLLFSCSITTFAVRLRSQCRVLVARLGRGTLTREPLDAATLRLLMTSLSLWLPRVGLRI